MTDIQAIKKAAEAIRRITAELEALSPITATIGAVQSKEIELQAARDELRRLLRNNATVLELCRLAGIGLASNGESGVQRGHSLPRQLQWEDGIEPAKMPKDGAV